MRPDTNYSFDPLTSSFRQLKAAVGSTAGQKLPGAKALRDAGTEILFFHERGDMTITVFKSGFFIYQVGEYETVFAIDRCRQISYKYQNDEVRIITESEFADGPCLVPLLTIGDRRLEQNGNRSESYWSECSISSAESSGLKANEYAASLEDDYLRRLDEEESKARMEEALSTLTNRQRKIAEMFFLENMSQREIAESLNIRPQSVMDVLVAAKSRLRKFFESETENA